MKKTILTLASLGLAIGSLLTVGACSKSSSDDAAATSYAYHGPGSKWTSSFTGGNFEIKKFASATATAADVTVNGTYVDYSTGFRKLTVTSASGTGAPSAGTQAYGFEVPGFAFFLKPIGADSEVIAMVKSGACPTSTFNANWITAKTHSGTLGTSNDTFGSASFTINGASSAATINKRNPVDGGVPTSGNASDTINYDMGSCSGGVLTFSPGGSETVDMFFTSNGGALVHSYDTGNTHNSIIFAGPRQSAAVTLADLIGTYSVLVFNDSNATNKVFPAKLTIPSSGAWTGTELTSIETDATGAGSVSFTGFAAHALSPGLFNATLGADGRVSCTYISYDGSKVVACNGYDGATNKKLFFLLGKSR